MEVAESSGVFTNHHSTTRIRADLSTVLLRLMPQARRKQLQIGGGGGGGGGTHKAITDWGAHINFFKMTDLCNGGGGAYLCKLLGGGGARPPVPPLFLRPCADASRLDKSG